LSQRQSECLAELRKQASGDEDSLHYIDAGQAKNDAADESNGDDVYDDTNEDLYEEVGTAQSPACNQQPQPLRQDVDYEISAAAFPSTPASARGWYSWLFTFFQSLTLFPSHPLCVHRSSFSLGACLLLFRSYSDDGCRRKQAVYLDNLVSLITFII